MVLVLLAFAAGIAPAADPAEFKVIVNVSNPMESIGAKDLSRLFLKKDTVWPDGSTVAAVDLPPDSAIREAFSMAVHGRKVVSIKSYWQRQIFAGKTVPPVERANQAEVLVFVALNPAAIGYAGPTTELIDNVKELKVTD
jgi:hypothetical protein